MAEIFRGKAFLLVTGASRGIGKAIAEVFAAHLNNGSRVLLLARNAENLKTIADGMPKGLVASYKSIDFSATTTDALHGALQESLEGTEEEHFERAVIVHCAAMVGDSQLTIDMTDFDRWRQFFDLNVFSPAVLNGLFAKTFRSKSVRKYVINVSSYWGLKPDAYVGSYCAAKAAKDMFFRTFAKENPDVTVMNYLPGLVETDMFWDSLNTSKNEELVTKLKAAIKNESTVSPTKTAECLLKALEENNFKSGDYVDYMTLNP